MVLLTPFVNTFKIILNTAQQFGGKSLTFIERCHRHIECIKEANIFKNRAVSPSGPIDFVVSKHLSCTSTHVCAFAGTLND